MYLQNSGGTIPNTSTLSHSSRAMAMVNQPVLNQELEIFLEDKVTKFYEELEAINCNTSESGAQFRKGWINRNISE